MPIERRYDIDPALTGAANLLIGQTEYAQRQAVAERAIERERQAAEAAEQDAIRRAEQSRILGNARRAASNADREVGLAHATAIANAARHKARGEAAEAAAEYSADLNSEYGSLVRSLLGAQRGREGDVADLFGQQQKLSADQQLWAQKNVSLWEVESSEALEKDIAGIQASMAKQQKHLTPEGRRLYGQLSHELRSIQAVRGEARPQAYSKLLGQWLDNFERSGVTNHIEAPPTPEELYNQRVFRIDERNAYVLGPDGKGRIEEIVSVPSAEEQDFNLRKREMDFEAKRWDLFAKQVDVWAKQAPKPEHFTKSVPGPNGTQIPGMPDQEAFQQAWATWQAMKPAMTPMQGSQVPGSQAGVQPLPTNFPQNPAMDPMQQQAMPAEQLPAEPLVVNSPAELRQAIESGQLPIGGKYTVNGIVFTRKR